jgi:hypothetical protein
MDITTDDDRPAVRDRGEIEFGISTDADLDGPFAKLDQVAIGVVVRADRGVLPTA